MEHLNKNMDKINKLNAFVSDYMNADLKNRKDIYEKYKKVIDTINPIDIFHLNIYSDNSSTSNEIIKSTANLFVNIFNHPLQEHSFKDHHHSFFKALMKENEEIIKHLDSIKKFLKSGDLESNRDKLLTEFIKCLDFEKKFIKKENILFPHLESKLVSRRPLKIMWMLHDDARVLIKELISLLKEQSFDEISFKEKVGKYYFLIYGIITKENLILYPVAAKLLDDTTLDIMLKESIQYGFSLFNYIYEESNDKNQEKFMDGNFKVLNGDLTFSQLNLMLNNLPIDITFVDEFNKVKYFNQTKNRHFPRSPSIIGRLVEYCHPPKSVDTVKKIIESFRSGEEDFAEFWIKFKESLIYIQYFAVRDNSNQYRGVLEVSQDVTHIRNLKGEKRILEW